MLGDEPEIPWEPGINANDPLTPAELDRIQRRDKDKAVSPRDWERLQRMPKGERETLC